MADTQSRITDTKDPNYWNQPEFDPSYWFKDVPLLQEFGRWRPAHDTAGIGAGPYTENQIFTTDTAYNSSLGMSPKAWAEQQINQAFADQQIGEQERNELLAEAAAGIPLSDVTNNISSRAAAQQGRLNAKRTQSIIDTATNKTLPALDKELAYGQGQEQRFNLLVNNPSLMRSDQDYGNDYAQAIDTINSQLGQSQRNLTGNTVHSGLAASGKANALQGRLEMQAGANRAGVQQDLLTDIRSRREATHNRNFNLELMRPDLASGDADLISKATGAYGNIPSYTNPGYQDTLQARLGNLGRGDIDFSKGMQFLNLLLGAADSAGNKATSLLGSFVPGQR